MRHDDIDRVFGRSRLQMVTGDHVEVFREEALPGERRRYTKRFLSTTEGDFRHWTEREWRILARLVGHGIKSVPDVVQFDRGALGRPALVQTYDAGVTVDHWATLLPVERDGRVLRHVFEDCAHWWALAHHCLIALDAIHELHLVHLDLKADNVCIPLGPADFVPDPPGQVLQPQFEQIALIDFAFSLVSGDNLSTAFPIGHQADYDYQSPRLLQALEAGRRGDLLPTRQLDWRCDFFSLAAMLRRYLPRAASSAAPGWKNWRHAQAQALVRRLVEVHDHGSPAQRPHRELIDTTLLALSDAELAASLTRGWRLAPHSGNVEGETPTPVTRIAMPIVPVTAINAAAAAPAFAMPAVSAPELVAAAAVATKRRRPSMRQVLLMSAVVAGSAASVPLLGEAWMAFQGDEHVAAADEPALPSPPTHAVAKAPDEAPAAAKPEQIAVVEPAKEPVAEPVEAPASAAAPAPPAPAPTAVAAPAPVRAAAPSPVAVAKAKTPAPPARTAPRKPAPAPRTAAVKKVAPPAPSLSAADTSAAAARAFVMRALARAPAPAVAPVAAPAAPVAAAPTPAVVVAAAPPQPATAVTTVTVAPPASAAPAPARVVPPPPRSVAVPAALPEDFVARAGVLLAEHLPRATQRAERMVLRVLQVAARSDSPWQDDEVLVAARAVRAAPDPVLAGLDVATEDARLLNDAAKVAFWRGRNPRQALNLQTRAFGANPHDQEVAGNFAFFHLVQNPTRPETARQLALHALTTQDSRYPDGRAEDWTTFAVASALVGRERDARNAFFVSLALASNLERPCRAAVDAHATYGDRLKGPVEAMMERVRSWGRSHESPYCRMASNMSTSNVPIGVRLR